MDQLPSHFDGLGNGRANEHVAQPEFVVDPGKPALS
jgi:hypothetical protein